MFDKFRAELSVRLIKLAVVAAPDEYMKSRIQMAMVFVGKLMLTEIEDYEKEQ